MAHIDRYNLNLILVFLSFKKSNNSAKIIKDEKSSTKTNRWLKNFNARG